MEEIIIHSDGGTQRQISIDDNFALAPVDTATLLKNLPGANLNGNGPITGIVQYRGLYGDRVNVNIDHSPALTGGPNAMDTPLSYTPPLLLKALNLHRGPASVGEAQESLGGHLSAELDRGEFSTSENLAFSGALISRFNGNADGSSTALKTIVANQHHKLSVLASHDEGNDSEIADNAIIGGSQYRRSRYDLGYGCQDATSDTSFQIFTGKLDTRDTGTPALPMDINFIESDLAGFNASTTLGNAKISGFFAYSHVDHGMDNFSQRQAPASPMMYRSNHATALGKSWKLQARWNLDSGQLTLGTDGNLSGHNAEITNPNNAAFTVHNFNDIDRDIIGLFAQWNTDIGPWNIESGLRYNRIALNADKINASGLMGMMGMNVQALATRFNSADRDINHNNIDAVFKAQTPLGASTSLQLAISRKNRTPSYQEHYLWLPLAATGGLADGRSYTGNLDLDSETSNELTAGINWQNNRAWITPELFYRRIDNYIQGVPSSDATANAVSTMMSGQGALTFDNIDVQMYGFDMAYGYQLTEHFSVQGNLSFVRGKRTDQTDNLYRVAPFNHRIALTYQNQDWLLSVESLASAKQTKVSQFNDELPSSGYGIINVTSQYQLASNISISAGANNLFDKPYQDHLAGYNRNGDSDIAVGNRLPGAGQNLFIAVSFAW